MTLPVLDGCQNPRGCRKVATVTLAVTDGETSERVNLCAYCAADVRDDERHSHLDITEVE